MAPLSHRRQVWGWLSYAFASEVFAVCSLSFFLPICLEQFARDNGFLLPGRTVPCPTVGSADDARCVVRLGWLWVDSASYSLYVYSASVALQALTVISLGGVADDPRRRKRLLLTFAVLGSLSSLFFLILPSTSVLWPTSAFLAIVANVSFGTSIVSHNSYLPQLARGEEDVRGALTKISMLQGSPSSDILPAEEEPREDDEHEDDEHAPLTTRNTDPSAADGHIHPDSMGLATYNELLSRATSRISSRGIAIGYTAGIMLLLIILIPVTLLKGSTFSMRLAIGMTGLWWAAFTVPAAVWLPSDAGSPVPGVASGYVLSGSEDVTLSAEMSETSDIWKEILAAWRRLGYMLHPKEISKLRNTFWFLLAWFLLSDGCTTLTSTAVLFAKTAIHMPASSLIILGALAPSAGILGAIVWPMAQRRFNLSNLQSMIILVSMILLVPIYGCLGFLPVFRDDDTHDNAVSIGNRGARYGAVKFGGLTTPGEMYVLTTYFGLSYGAFQSYARAVFSELIPPGEEARWFGLYSITDKSSSFFGPLIVGLIADTTGNIRYAFFFLAVMLSTPIPVLHWCVEMTRGRRDARAYVRERARGVE